MKNVFYGLAYLMVLALVPFAQADETLYNCKIDRVLDGGIESGYENVNDFTFEEYPYLTLRSDGSDKYGLSVGAMGYSMLGDSEDDGYSSLTLKSLPTQNQEIITVMYDDLLTVTATFEKLKTGQTIAFLDSYESEPGAAHDKMIKTRVAQFKCGI